MAHGEQGRVISKFVLHAYEPPNGDEFITILMDDKVFQIRPHEPYEMSADSNGRLLDHPGFYLYQLLQTYAGLYGLVEVESRRERSGIVLDVDKAETEATRLLERNRWEHIQAWVNHQLNERVAHGKAVMPPVGFVEESIKHLNIDLEARYRLRPIGWDWKPSDKKPVLGLDLGFVPATAAPPMSAEIAALRDELALKDQKMERIEALLAQLLEKDADTVSVGGPVERKKGKG